jgi:ATP-dependent helicase HrpA
MSRSDLMQRDVPEAGEEQFPDTFEVGGNQLPLRYKFDPAEPADGVTLIVPEPLLDVVNAEQAAWLVPGLRLEKVIGVFRALPKAQRKLLVPVPDFARQALDDLGGETARLGRLPGFHEWVAEWVTQRVGATVTAAALAALPVPDHLRMNFRVLDAKDGVLAEGRDLLEIKRKLYATTSALHVALVGGAVAGGAGHGAPANGAANTVGARGGGGAGAGGSGKSGAGRAGVGGSGGSGAGRGSAGPGARGHSGERAGAVSLNSRTGGVVAGPASSAALQGAAAPVLYRAWDFGELPVSREVERNRMRLVVYPAIEDRITGVAVIEARNAPAAEAISRIAMVRLAMLALPQQAKYVSKRMTDDRDLVLLSRGLPFHQSLADALTQRAFRECFFPTDVALPRDAQSFGKALDEHRAQLNEVADRLATTVTSTLKEWRAARAGLDGLRSGSYANAVADIDAQLAMLLPPDFIESTPHPWLDYLPRYLKGVTRRIEKLPPNVRRDAELAAKVKPFSIALRALMAQPAVNGPRPELDQLRWMIEEFRVSLFAQDLKTMLRVSDKRLSEQLASAREAQR